VKRVPTTFTLMLGLLVLALTLALGLAAMLSLRAGMHVSADTYGRLVAATAIATDELSVQANPPSAHALDALGRVGVHVVSTPPPPRARVAPLIREVGATAGRLLGDPSRVQVTQTPEAHIWVRSARDPSRWIVMRALSYRREVIDSTLVTTLVAGLIALAMAVLAARLLTRPLERLAANAKALLAGESMHATLHGSPREVRRLAQAIGDAGARQREAARERELMLAGISHDLRTPLARLRLALELGDAADPQRREAMITDLDELDTSLEQCLAYVRDGSDETLREIDIATLLGQLLALREHPDDWQLDGLALLPTVVRPTLLRRAIGNLMDNAERYGAAPFTVTLRCEADHCCVRVADAGPGVPTSLLDQLGRPFLRGDAARGGKGSGLGLSIVMRAAELHGGKLDLAIGDGGGFVATLRIPTNRA
jgi:two-component system osmolarity sensor histidine kinase EnvZ